jgi:hypothetical protein
MATIGDTSSNKAINDPNYKAETRSGDDGLDSH